MPTPSTAVGCHSQRNQLMARRMLRHDPTWFGMFIDFMITLHPILATGGPRGWITQGIRRATPANVGKPTLRPHIG